MSNSKSKKKAVAKKSAKKKKSVNKKPIKKVDKKAAAKKTKDLKAKKIAAENVDTEDTEVTKKRFFTKMVKDPNEPKMAEVFKEKFSKGEIIRIMICTLLTAVLAVSCAYFLSISALAEARQKYSEDVAEYEKTRYNYLSIDLNDGVSLDQLDTALSAYSEDYKGILATSSIFDATYLDDHDDETDTTVLIYNEYMTEDIFTADEVVGVPSGYYAAYYTGWNWVTKNVGKQLLLTVRDASGSPVLINVVIVGAASPYALAGNVAGESVVDAYSSMLTIVGYDVNELSANANDKVYAYSTSSLDAFPLSAYGTLYDTSSIEAANSAYDASLDADLALGYAPHFKIYFYATALAICWVLMLILGGRHRAMYIIGFALVHTAVMILFEFLLIKKNVYFAAYDYTFTAWFSSFLFLSLVFTFFLAIINVITRILRAYHQEKTGRYRKEDKPADDEELAIEEEK